MTQKSVGGSAAMTAGIFVVDVLAVACFSLLMLRKYGDIRKSYAVSATVLITWFFSFSIVTILPLDVSAAFYRNCVHSWYCGGPGDGTPECAADGDFRVSRVDNLCHAAADCKCEQPWSYINDETLPSFWGVVYWSSQLLTWAILPLMESYMSAGDFTFLQKFKSAVRENALVYLSAGALFFVLFCYIAIVNKLSSSDIKQIAIAASNTWGLLLLVVMLGYGLVDVPRWLWRRSNRKLSMKLYHFRAAKLSSEMIDNKERYDALLDEVRSVSGRISASDPLRPFINQIIASTSIEFNPDTDTFQDFDGADMSPITRKSLAKLNKKLIKTHRIVHRCQCQWDHLMDKIFALEDVINNCDSPTHRFISSTEPTYSGPFREWYPIARWYWKCKIEPMVFLGLAFIGTTLSIALVWSEVVFSATNPTLSLYALLIEWAGKGQQYFNVELVTFLSIFYLCVCAYRVIFKLRVFNLYYLVPHQQTDSSSLLFSAMFLSRLTAPLCLNFISMSHLDSHVTARNVISEELAFTEIMGHMDVVAFMKNFNTYYPMIILILSFGTFFRLASRFLSLFGFQRFIDDDDGADEFISEGKALVSRERRSRQRKAAGERDPAERIARFTAERRSRGGGSSASGSSRGGGTASASRSPPKRSAFGLSNHFGLGGVKSFLGFGGQAEDDEEELLPTRLSSAASRGGSSGRGSSGRGGSTRTKPSRDLFNDI
eukprot:m.58389 g.58389  ORF g.58389 m.58389 type:complete len:715 (+) comp7140_c0_seq1:132-2276(+)